MSALRDFYYDVKPFLPIRLRLAFRRALAKVQLQKAAGEWPVFSEAGNMPQDWPGWPGGKKFALVLTHDIEGIRGLQNCTLLSKLEKEFGLRSSFNFIPEGPYKVAKRLIESLKDDGFEVGVHDLHHNGKLYRNKASFDAAAPRINRYLGDWGAVGFRSGFMHRNLDWLHALDIDYDMSTFDTDPFEPQPDGVHTIFPFFIPHPERAGYVELPYTLAQDSTLFLLLEHQGIDIWKKKLDWIAERGGMALVNVHPDYLQFDGQKKEPATFPVTRYTELLNYVRKKYDSSVAYMLPKDVAGFVQQQAKYSVGHPVNQ